MQSPRSASRETSLPHPGDRVGATLSLIGILLLGWAGSTFPAAAQTPLVDYSFDAGSGSTAANTGSATSAAATLHGGAGWTTNTPGGTGSALNLSSGASTDFASAGTVASLEGLSQFTITLWVNLQAAPSASDRLVSTLNTSLAGLDFVIAAPTSGSTTLSASNFSLKLEVNGTSGAAVAQEGTGISAANQWAFVAVTYDGTSSSSNVLFYSGTQSATAAQLGGAQSITSGSVSGTTGALEIGATAASGSDRTPPAYLDDVRIYGSVLTAAQINAIRLDAVPEPRTAALLLGVLLFLAVPAFRRRIGA